MAECVLTVVIATRNRAEKLARLLKCIQAQDLQDFECIVVDDVSSSEVISQYQTIRDSLDARFNFHLRSHSGGPSQARNTGITLAQGKYIAFCDDDDYWVRADHLSTAVRALTQANGDLFLSNMQTSINGVVDNPNWYSSFGTLGKARLVAQETDVYRLQRGDLENALLHRILHANTLVVSRALLLDIGMYWEKISFAEDHDISFRLADRAQQVLFRSTVTADLDVSPHPSIARTYSEKERLYFGMVALIHAESSLTSAALRKVARANRAWKLLQLAELHQQEGKPAAAKEIILQSLSLKASKTGLLNLLKVLFKRGL